MALPLAEARRLDGRPVVIPLDKLGVWDRCGKYDAYAVASDDDSERGVLAPAGCDLRGQRWAVGVIRVIDHPQRAGEAGTVFPGFVEVLVILDR